MRDWGIEPHKIAAIPGVHWPFLRGDYTGHTSLKSEQAGGLHACRAPAQENSALLPCGQVEPVGIEPTTFCQSNASRVRPGRRAIALEVQEDLEPQGRQPLDHIL